MSRKYFFYPLEFLVEGHADRREGRDGDSNSLRIKVNRSGGRWLRVVASSDYTNSRGVDKLIG